MKMRHFFALSLVLVLFQNCAEPVDLSAYNSSVNPEENPNPNPTAPTATLVSQSPANTTVIAGQAASLFIAATITPAATAVVYEWYFNDALISSGPTLSMYNINPTLVTNSGTYKVVIKEALTLNILLQSQNFVLTVQPSTVVSDPAILTNNAINFTLTLGNGFNVNQMALSFCRTKHGPNATAVSVVAKTPIRTNRYVANTNTCNVSTRIFNLGNGLCAYDSIFTFDITPYRVECRPN